MGPKVESPLAHVADRTIPGPGGDLPIRLYTPNGAGPFPLVLYFHGGGFVVGDLDTQDSICRALAHAAGVTVVSVDYRLAPEHPFPAAIEDAWAALHWAKANGASFNADSNLLACAGDSAGGIITCALAIKARDENGPQLKAQINFYGSCDYLSSPTASSIEFKDGPIITEQDIHYYWSQYLANEEAEQHNPYASPARAKSHAGLPPAFICAGECDPERDRTEAYGAKLAAAGVDAVVKRYPGMPHGFISWVAWLPAAQSAVNDAAAWLNTRLDRTP